MTIAVLAVAAITTDGGGAVTVPAGTTGVVVTAMGWGDGREAVPVASMTLAGHSLALVNETHPTNSGQPNLCWGSYFGAVAEGAATLAVSWGSPWDNGRGPFYFVAFLSGAGAVRDTGFYVPEPFGEGLPVAATVDSTAQDLVLAALINWTTTPAIAGATELSNATLPGRNGRIAQMDSPGASATTATVASTNYAGLQVISLIAAEIGGALADAGQPAGADAFSGSLHVLGAVVDGGAVAGADAFSGVLVDDTIWGHVLEAGAVAGRDALGDRRRVIYPQAQTSLELQPVAVCELSAEPTAQAVFQ
jgi:hypothetical protein